METKADATLTSPATLANPDPALYELFGIEPSLTGEAFAAEMAMKCTASRAAILAISETLGTLPVHTFSLAPDGTRERDRSHPVDALLNVAACPWMPGSEFRELLTRDALLYGRGTAFINRASDGRVLELQRLIPGTVSVNVDTMTGEPSYILAGQERTLSAGDVIDIRAPFTRLPIAASPTLDCREAIALALTLERHAARLFAKGARPSGLIAFKGKKSPAEITNARSGFGSAFSGSRSGGTMMLDDDARFTPLAFTSVDAQFMEQRRFAIEEIARTYRVPPVLLMEYGRATWGNSEEMGRQFVTYSLRPWIKRWESEIRMKLLGEGSCFAEFQLDDLTKADTVQRFEAYSKAIAARILNPNEVRELENRAPYAEGAAFVNPAIQTADVGR